MRYPIKANKPTNCPVCKKRIAVAASKSPRPESASLSFVVMSHVHGRSYPVFLGSLLMLGWDSGISKHPQSRSTLGAALEVANKSGRDPDVGELELKFCTTRCMRRFFKEAIDELDRRKELQKPAVRKAKKSRPGRGSQPPR